MQRWRVLLYYAIAVYGFMYMLGTLHIPTNSLLHPVAVARDAAGLPSDADSRARLMRVLALPSVVLLLLQLYRAGLGTQYWMVFQPTNMDYVENLYGGAGVAEAYVQVPPTP
jgi:hypothetical protein